MYEKKVNQRVDGSPVLAMQNANIHEIPGNHVVLRGPFRAR
jgi:hypothetical protein